MRLAGGPSWQVTLDVPQVLAVALYIRDVAGVTQTAPPVDLPEVAPSVTAGGIAATPSEVTGQWNEWWMRALTIGPYAFKELQPPHFPAFADASALRDLLRAYFDDALRWSADCKRSSAGPNTRALPFGELVSAVEHGIGRAASPFRLRIDVVPVVGHGMWRVQPAHIVVSSALLKDQALLLAGLRSEIELLA